MAIADKITEILRDKTKDDKFIHPSRLKLLVEMLEHF